MKYINDEIPIFFDGGIRAGVDALIAFDKGADLVGIGRPVIYANVLYGKGGVYSILNKFIFEIRQSELLSGYEGENLFT